MQDKAQIVDRLREWGKIYDDTDAHIKEIKRLLTQMEDAAQLSALSMDGMPHSGAPGDPVFRAAAAREALATRVVTIEQDILDRLKRIDTIDRAVQSLAPNYQQLIRLHYRDGKTLTVQIPAIMHAAESTIRLWHDTAILHIAERLAEYSDNL